MTEVARTTESKIAKVEIFKIAEIRCFVDAVLRFVVAVVSIAYLIDLRFDAVALIAEIAVDPIALK